MTPLFLLSVRVSSLTADLLGKLPLTFTFGEV